MDTQGPPGLHTVSSWALAKERLLTLSMFVERNKLLVIRFIGHACLHGRAPGPDNSIGICYRLVFRGALHTAARCWGQVARRAAARGRAGQRVSLEAASMLQRAHVTR